MLEERLRYPMPLRITGCRSYGFNSIRSAARNVRKVLPSKITVTIPLVPAAMVQITAPQRQELCTNSSRLTIFVPRIGHVSYLTTAAKTYSISVPYQQYIRDSHDLLMVRLSLHVPVPQLFQTVASSSPSLVGAMKAQYVWIRYNLLKDKELVAQYKVFRQEVCSHYHQKTLQAASKP